MQIGVIGLGRMGGNITRRLMPRRDHTFAEEILSAMRKGFGALVEPRDHGVKP